MVMGDVVASEPGIPGRVCVRGVCAFGACVCAGACMRAGHVCVPGIRWEPLRAHPPVRIRDPFGVRNVGLQLRVGPLPVSVSQLFVCDSATSF